MNAGKRKKKLKDLATCLFGNRVTLLSTAILFTGTGLNTHNMSKITDNISQDSSAVNTQLESVPYYYGHVARGDIGRSKDLTLMDILSSFGALGLVTAGFSGIMITGTGRGTSRIYNRTLEHIRNTGRLDERYMRALISDYGYSNSKCMGYCELQGAYLAARETGQLEAFKDAKKKFSNNRIPNF